MRTGAMLQVARVPETLRVREHIELFSSYYRKPLKGAEVLASAGLQKLSERKFGELSGGQRQRVLFALAICGDPDLLFLDEPTVGLDVEARRMLWDEIRSLVRRGKTVLLTTHYLQEADALADRVAVINKGEIIAEGSPAQIKAQTAGKKIRCPKCGEPPQLLAGRERMAQRAGVVFGGVEVPEGPQARVGATQLVRGHDPGPHRLRQEEGAEPVLRELLSRDTQLSGLEVTSAGLEEAFLALTQDTSRNGAQSN